MTEELCPSTSVVIYQPQWYLHPTRTGSSSSADWTSNPIIIIIFTCHLLPDTSNIFWTMSLLPCFLSWTSYRNNLFALTSVQTVHFSCTAAIPSNKEWHMRHRAPHQRRWVFNISYHHLCSRIAENYIFFPSYKQLRLGLSGMLWCPAPYITAVPSLTHTQQSFSYSEYN